MIPFDLAQIIEPCDVLLVGRTGGVSEIIRTVTHSLFSHVALIDGTQGGVWVVVEATAARGVSARKIEALLDDPTVEHLSLLRCTVPFPPQDVSKSAWLQTGEPYSNGVNFKILLSTLGWKDPVLPIDGVNCAVMVNDAFFNGYHIQLIDPAWPTPQAFAVSSLLREVWKR